MLKYLWMVVQDLILVVTMTTWMHAFLIRFTGTTGRKVHIIGLLSGVVASIILAIVKGTTNRIISSHWNHYIYAVTLVWTVLFIVFSFLFARTASSDKKKGKICVSVSGAAISAVLIFYELPGVLLYPFNFNTMGNGYWSSYYMVRMAGWALALLLLVVYSRLLFHCALHIRRSSLIGLSLDISLLINAAYCFGRFFVPWVNRAKWLNWSVRYTDEAYGWIGDWMMFTANHSMLFLWPVIVLSAVFCMVFLLENTKIIDAYENPAQLRKLRARARSYRRIAACALVGLLIFTFTLTFIKAYDTRVIELSAPETYTVDGASILIPLENVNDGHLHRYEYKTENDINVRWIVVRKPNAASYGVGLDACDVCGASGGYYERKTQVVCILCDVVMNKATIGFAGGCNPVPLAFSVKDPFLIIDTEDLEAEESRFAY